MEKETDVSALAPGELELFVQSMEPPNIENIGSKSWIDWHQRLQKLNQQAVLEASSMMEEQTKEALISHGKLPVLVYEVICIFVWRTKIYPQILKLNPKLSNTFTLYMVLYHEAAAVGLLETVLYHEDGAQCLSDVIIDLVDYAQEMITSLISLTNAGYLEPKEVKAVQDENPVEELNRQQKDLQFDIAMRCISIIRYLSDHMDVEGAGAAIVSRLYRTHDTPSLMTYLLNIEPWKRLNEKGNMEYFIYGRWKRLSEEESQQMHRVEGQVWLCLRQLLLDKRLHDFYTIDNVRKTQFCRLQFKLTDCVLDQVPPLGELKAWFCRMGVTDVAGLQPPTKKAGVGSLVIEIIPQIKDDYLKTVHKRCKSIAQRQTEQLFSSDHDQMVELARKLTDTYAGDTAQMLDDGGAKCAACGDLAPRRCSRCKTAWYCGRECQVKQWPQHRDICDQFAKYG